MKTMFLFPRFVLTQPLTMTSDPTGDDNNSSLTFVLFILTLNDRKNNHAKIIKCWAVSAIVLIFLLVDLIFRD